LLRTAKSVLLAVMKKQILSALLITVTIQFAAAQKQEPAKDKKTVKEVIGQLPEMLLAQPAAKQDSSYYILSNDNVSVRVDSLWQESGMQVFGDLKLQKIDEAPLKSTFPLPNKQLVKALTISLGTTKKTAEEKKQAVLKDVKNHLAALYKEGGKAANQQELTTQVNSMISAAEKFTTEQGKTGDVYLINDVQTNQSNFIVLLLLPSADGTKVSYLQFSYAKFNYDTNLPEDVMEWRTFVFDDDRDAFVAFTKNIMKSFSVKEK
jgi:hypothetical protein